VAATGVYEGADPMHVQEMLEAYPRDFDVEARKLAATIEVVEDCANACTQCADACV
jgi:hypothetical protein